jgi:diguanylate cyclase (GGDEF)-like protein
VLVLTADPAAQARWRGWLSAAGLTVLEQVSGGELPHVVVVGPAADAGTFVAGDAAVLRIGHEGPADAHLPADCSPRELVTACRLAAQVTRLRLQLRASSAAEAALREASETDPLTGLANRRAWQQELERRRAACAGGAVLGLAILDLDRFKEINDTQGYAAGDVALALAARALRSGLRPSDFVARLGGDEFGLLVTCSAAEDVPRVVERVRAALAEHTAGLPQPLAASAGCVAVEPGSGITGEALLARADAALREAKRRGGQCTQSG